MIPEGFAQIAESLLPGTGGIIATAYQKRVEGEKQIFLVVKSPDGEEFESGPFPIRFLTTMEHLFQDILFINGIRK